MVTPFSRPTFAVENIVWLCPAIVRCFHHGVSRGQVLPHRAYRAMSGYLRE